MAEDRLWVLLAKRKSGEASPAELEELEYLIQQQKISQSDINTVDTVLDKFVSLPQLEAGDAVWEKIEQQTFGRESKVRVLNLFTRKWMAAAGIILVVSISWFSYNMSGSKTTGSRQVAVSQLGEASKKMKLRLPDGTLVWLNKGSKLTYHKDDFGNKLREVALVGEAFFDVVKNEQVPFVIHTSTLNITVKGTAFNVKAYPYQKTVETALVRGLIEITTLGDPDRKIILKPNEKIIVPVLQSARNSVPATDTVTAVPQALYSIEKLRSSEPKKIAETSWLENSLAFDNETFEDLAPRLESFFATRIVFQDEAIKKRCFSAIIEKEDLRQTLTALALSYPFQFVITDNNTVLINKK